MSKYFVISTDPLTKEQEKQFKEFLTGQGWWHWLPNFWLLKDSAETLSAAAIRDQLRAMDSTKRVIVLEVTPVTWSALKKPDKHGRNMVEWIKNNWQSD